MNDEAMDPVRLYIYLHTSRLSVCVGLPAAVSAVATLSSSLQPPLVSKALFLQLLIEDAGCVFSQRVARRSRQVLPYAHHLWVFVPLRFHNQLHGAG